MRYNPLFPFKWWPLKLWKITFVIMAIAYRINWKVCGFFKIPVRKYILPRLRIKVGIKFSRAGRDKR